VHREHVHVPLPVQRSREDYLEGLGLLQQPVDDVVELVQLLRVLLALLRVVPEEGDLPELGKNGQDFAGELLESLNSALVLQAGSEHVFLVLDHGDDHPADLKLLDGFNLGLVDCLAGLLGEGGLDHVALLLVLLLGVEGVGLVDVEHLHELQHVVGEETALLLAAHHRVGQELHCDSLQRALRLVLLLVVTRQ
jgi:hypothetical protein